MSSFLMNPAPAPVAAAVRRLGRSMLRSTTPDGPATTGPARPPNRRAVAPDRFPSWPGTGRLRSADVPRSADGRGRASDSSSAMPSVPRSAARTSIHVTVSRPVAVSWRVPVASRANRGLRSPKVTQRSPGRVGPFGAYRRSSNSRRPAAPEPPRPQGRERSAAYAGSSSWKALGVPFAHHTVLSCCRRRHGVTREGDFLRFVDKIRRRRLPRPAVRSRYHFQRNLLHRRACGRGSTAIEWCRASVIGHACHRATTEEPL